MPDDEQRRNVPDTGPLHDLQQELLQCYSRPEFTQLNTQGGDHTFTHLRESVFVECRLEEREVKPINGRSDLQDSIKKEGKPVQSLIDMVPPPTGERVLLTGFVGSGKTSVCIHLIYQWLLGMKDDNSISDINNTIHKYSIVFFLRARALETNIYQSLVNVLGEFSQLDLERKTLIRDVLLHEKSILIMLDGYDEATSSQKKMIDEIVSSKTMSHASVILTSRPHFFHGIPDKWYNILGFNKEQQMSFINKFKSIIPDEESKHFDNFELQFLHSKNAAIVFTSPMMAMNTCTMVAAGDEIDFCSRIKNYQQLAESLERRACFKSNERFTDNQLIEAMPAFREAAYHQMLEKESFQFTRKELLNYITPDTLDNVIIYLGYMCVTQYIISSSTHIAYTFVHKSWAEFTAAKHVMNLPIADRSTAVCQLFMSGPANLEVLRFALGLCSENDPSLFRAAAEIVGKLDINQTAIDQEMEAIKTIKGSGIYALPDITEGSAYLLLLLVDTDPQTLPSDVLCELGQLCASIRQAAIGAATVGEKIQQHIDVSPIYKCSACVLYAGLMLATHSVQHSLHTVNEVSVKCESDSPHSTVTCFPTTLATYAPGMTALTKVDVRELVSSSELITLCNGLLESKLPCLTHLSLRGDRDLKRKAGNNMSYVSKLVKTAAQLKELELWFIHAGDQGQLAILSAAIEESVSQLIRLVLHQCSVSAQQYNSILLPALHNRLTAGRALLGEVRIVREGKDGGSRQEWKNVKTALGEVAENVTAE